jgi:hypothetical protein
MTEQQIGYALISIGLLLNLHFILGAKKRRKMRNRLLACVETLRCIHHSSDTIRNGKGVIPRKLWNDTKKIIVMTSDIKTGI